MRRFIAILLCLSMLLSLAACGDQADSSVSDSTAFDSTFGTEASSAEETQNTATAGSFAIPYNANYGWDPYNCIGMENRAVMGLIYEGLFTLNNSFEAENALCESYTVDETGLIYTINLRSAQFSNGKTLTAKDVVYSFKQAEDSTLYSERFNDINSFKASGDSTVTITLDNQNDLLPTLLDFPIIPNKSKKSPIGTGPFVLNETSLTKNSYWWNDASTISFNVVSLYESTSAEDSRDNFEIDKIDILYNNPSASSAVSFHCDYELWTSYGTTMEFLGFNNIYGIFQDASVRAAITKAIDRDSLVAGAYSGNAIASSLPVSPMSSLYDEELADTYDYNPSEALDDLTVSGSFYLPSDKIAALKAAMNMSGNKTSTTTDEEDDTEEDTDAAAETEAAEETTDDTGTGTTTAYNSIVFMVENGNANRLKAADLIKENLEAVGFTVDMQIINSSRFASTLGDATYDIFLGEITLRPDFDLRELILGYGSANYSFIYGDDNLYTYVSQALENSGNYYDLYQYVMDNGYICPLLFESNAVYTMRGVFTGLNPSPDNVFYDIKNITVN